MNELPDLSIADLGRSMRGGTLTSVDLTESLFERIDRFDGQLNCFVVVLRERAIMAARAADAAFAAGIDQGVLQGIPFAVKDVFDVAGVPTTCHSAFRLDAVAEADAHVVALLEAGGAVLLGKLATHEFALGGPSFDLPFPPARNPWNSDHVPGGSSSGSAAAVAAGFVPLALGSDTLGSIRGPAAYCGVVGLKPTAGLVSRNGVFPLSPSLDHCGPITWSVADAALAMQVIARPDARDPADVAAPQDHAPRATGIAGLRIGVPRRFFAHEARLSPETAAAFEAAVQMFRDAGALVEDVELPDYDLFNMCARIIMHAEAYAIHAADLRSRADGYARATLTSLRMGAFIDPQTVDRMQMLRQILRAAVDDVLTRVDALFTVNALTPAPRFDAPPSGTPLDPPMQNSSFNLTGHPALSVPTGLSEAGLPLSAQIVGRAFDERTVLRLGAVIEVATQPSRRRPVLS